MSNCCSSLFHPCICKPSWILLVRSGRVGRGAPILFPSYIIMLVAVLVVSPPHLRLTSCHAFCWAGARHLLPLPRLPCTCGKIQSILCLRQACMTLKYLPRRTEMGGPSASRSIDKGSNSVLAVLKMQEGTTGGFYFDGKPRDFI